MNFRKKKWLICASYNPHKSKISNHLHHSGKGIDSYIRNYDNILLLRDFYSEFSETCLHDFCDMYNHHRNRNFQFLQTGGHSLKSLL